MIELRIFTSRCESRKMPQVFAYVHEVSAVFLYNSPLQIKTLYFHILILRREELYMRKLMHKIVHNWV